MVAVCTGMGRWRWLQFNQREDLHPGRRTLPDPEGAVRPQRQGDGSVLRRGSLRPERSRETRRESRHLEGGIEGTGLCSAWVTDTSHLVTSQPRGPSLRRRPGTVSVACWQIYSHGNRMNCWIQNTFLLKCIHFGVVIVLCFIWSSYLTTLVLSNKCLSLFQ